MHVVSFVEGLLAGLIFSGAVYTYQLVRHRQKISELEEAISRLADLLESD